MTRPAPQPGETPRPDGNPWAPVDPGAEWWRGDTAAHPIVTPGGGSDQAVRAAGPETNDQAGDGADAGDAVATGPARAAGATDLAEAAAAGRVVTIPHIMGTEPGTGTAHGRTATSAGDADDRYDEPTDDVLAGTPRRNAEASDVPLPPEPRDRAEPASPDSPSPGPASPGPASPGPASPDSPSDDDSDSDGSDRRPGEGPDRSAEPAQRTGPTTQDEPTRDTRPARQIEPVRQIEPPQGAKPTRAPEPVRAAQPVRSAAPARVAQPVRQRPAGTSARDRAAPQQSAAAARLETSPFWLGGDGSDQGGAVAAPGRLGVPPRRVPPAPRRPASGLIALVLLAMVATFFAWVSAEPLWLAVGHGERGTAVVSSCTGAGVGQRCRGAFTADGGSTAVPGVTLLGVAADRRATGAVVPARMVSTDGRRAYAGASDLTLHLRWAIGVLIVLLSGLLIAAATGARRLETARARRTAVLLSIAGPLGLLAGFLAVTY